MIGISTWEAFGSPQELMIAIEDNEWQTSLIKGWMLAALLQKNANWASAGLGWMIERNSRHNQRLFSPNLIRGLVSLLSLEMQDRWMKQLLKLSCSNEDTLIEILDILENFPFSLNANIGRDILMYIRNCLIRKEQNVGYKNSLIRRFCRILNLLAYKLSLEILGTEGSDNFCDQDFLELQIIEFDTFWRTLEFRQQMTQALLASK